VRFELRNDGECLEWWKYKNTNKFTERSSLCQRGCQAWRTCGMPFEMPQTFFSEHDVRHSFELRRNVTGVYSAWSQSWQF